MHHPWVNASFVFRLFLSGGRFPGLPDLSWALHVCVHTPRCPVLRSPFGDVSRVGAHFPLALLVGEGVWISFADAEASADVV